MPFLKPFDQVPTFTQAQTRAYLSRLGLDYAPLAERCSLACLTTIMKAAVQIPLDTSPWHLPEGKEDDESVTFRSGPGFPYELDKIFDIVVTQRRGAVCFSLNTLLAACLRGLGYNVAEMQARNNFKNASPDEEPVFGDASHMVLFVLCDGQIWHCDAGYGGGCPPCPVLLEEGATADSFQATESFLLKHEPLPGGLHTFMSAQMKGSYLLISVNRKEAYAAQAVLLYHVHEMPFYPVDIAAREYSMVSPYTGQEKRLLVTRTLSDGTRRTMVHFEGEETARLYERDGACGLIKRDETFPPTHSEIRRRLREEFGYAQ